MRKRKTDIRLGDINEGIYFIKANVNDNKVITKKMVVK